MCIRSHPLLPCSYGELGNAELVKKYGFALRHNPFTAVGLDKAGLLSDAKQLLGAAVWRRRSKLLREQTEVLEEDEEPFEVSWIACGRIVGAYDCCFLSRPWCWMQCTAPDAAPLLLLEVCRRGVQCMSLLHPC